MARLKNLWECLLTQPQSREPIQIGTAALAKFYLRELSDLFPIPFPEASGPGLSMSLPCGRGRSLQGVRSRNERADLRGYEQAGSDPEHIKVFATTDAAEKWFEENDSEGVAFEYAVLE